MRRLRIVERANDRECLAVFHWESGDNVDRVARWVFGYADNPGGWIDGHDITGIGPLFMGSSPWPWRFMFADGSLGICPLNQIDEALATCGLRRIEGGE